MNLVLIFKEKLHYSLRYSLFSSCNRLYEIAFIFIAMEPNEVSFNRTKHSIPLDLENYTTSEVAKREVKLNRRIVLIDQGNQESKLECVYHRERSLSFNPL